MDGTDSGYDPRVLVGDCRERLAELPDMSVDAVVTDPPYELSFMGSKWDGTGIAYDVDLWREVLRVLKPGGHLLAFGATRTVHRLTCAVEDAGFEIRDGMLHWAYGSGFPKSLDVSKALDKAVGAERPVVGSRTLTGTAASSSAHVGNLGGGSGVGASKVVDVTAPASDLARQWQGWGTALKPAYEPIVVARRPLAGTVAENVTEHGTGALNIDACRTGTQAPRVTQGVSSQGPAGKAIYGNGRGLKTEMTLSDPHDAGRWPANLVLSHLPECGDGGGCAAGCPAATLDQQSGTSRSPANNKTVTRAKASGSWAHHKPANDPLFGVGSTVTIQGHNDSGGASRFFNVFDADPLADHPPVIYQPKAPARERPVGSDGTRHPTVKSLALMRHLVRLVTPKGGTVLDPFLGSGTTAEAAIMEGFEWLGCELTVEYVPLIQQRIDRANSRTPPAPVSQPVTEAGKPPVPQLVQESMWDLLTEEGAA